MENVIVVLVLVAILGLASWYVIRAKKKGQKCIGCPSSETCSSCSCGCGGCPSKK